jgi:hypothetical protein
VSESVVEQVVVPSVTVAVPIAPLSGVIFPASATAKTSKATEYDCPISDGSGLIVLISVIVRACCAAKSVCTSESNAAQSVSGLVARCVANRSESVTSAVIERFANDGSVPVPG